MNNAPNDTENNDVRERVIFFLLFLTSEKVQQAFYRYIQPEKLAYEMFQSWFEEIYVPSERYMQSLKGDFSQKNVDKFEENFDVEELISMERFHRCVELRFDMLSEKYKSEKTIPLNAAWKNILKDAQYLLEELEPNAEKRQTLLEQKLKTLLDYRKPVGKSPWRHLL